MREVGAAYLRFLIDDMCAKFSLESMCALVKSRLAQGAGTVEEIAQAIMSSDPTLDIVSARVLGQAAVEALAETGDVAMRDERVVLRAEAARRA